MRFRYFWKSTSVTCWSQTQRLPRSSLLAAELTADMETMAPTIGSMDDSFYLPNFPHMAWVDPSELLAIVTPSLRARIECNLGHNRIPWIRIKQRPKAILWTKRTTMPCHAMWGKLGRWNESTIETWHWATVSISAVRSASGRLLLRRHWLSDSFSYVAIKM